jgi:hypothetical protein
MWKLNLAKSKYDPGPPPKSQTRTWKSAGKVSVEDVGAAGKPVEYGYTIKTDSKDYPTTGAVPNGADTVSTKRIAPTPSRRLSRGGGKQVEATRFAVSKDAKLLTITAKATKPSGQSFDNTILWDKQ